LQNAVLQSANFSSIATDERGLIQIFNVGAERMLGYTAAEVLNKLTPADLCDPQELSARAKALSQEMGLAIAPGFEAIIFRASRGIEDICELTFIRKDGSRFPASVSVTSLRDEARAIIGYLLIGTNNRARKRAKQTLLKAGALQNAIFNSANFSCIATDEKGVIQLFNVGAERMLGYAASEVLSMITPADISDPKEMVARAFSLSLELETSIAPGFDALVFKASRGIEDIYELTYIRKDGTRFPAVVSVTALRDEMGAIIGYLLIGTDNSARRRAEEALQKAGALQHAMFHSANFSSIATDDMGVIQVFNVGAERMLGYAASEVVDKITPAAISDPQEVVTRAKALSLELATPISPGFEALVFKASRGMEDIYELTYIRKDGTRFPAIVSVTALRDEQGAIIGYLLIGTDNTARKQAEETLRRTEESFRLMVESVTDYAIVLLDTDGRIASWNIGAQRIKGYEAEEIVGRHFSQFYLPEDIELGRPQRDLALAEEGGRLEDEGWRVRKDGSTFWASTVFTAIRDQAGVLRGFAQMTQDLTERRRVEAELTDARLLSEKASLAKSEFLSSMSHEVRSPLNAILGFAQLMESESPSPTQGQRQRIAQILQGGWHLLTLIDEILDLAQVESGRVPLASGPVSLAEVLLECRSAVEPQAQERGIEMAFPVFDTPLFVRADRLRLKQVLLNLLSNAIKYNMRRGRVEVTFAETTPERMRVSVLDTGPGLYPEQLAQLFQAFNRLGQEAGGEEGTGIGLVLAKQLVELMGGRIGVESTVGLGSVFWFELNSAAAPQLPVLPAGERSSGSPEAPAEEKPRTLLYVEDDAANLTLVEQIIARRPDMRLLTAVNGNRGIEMARLYQPDVVLLDINLPGINGYEALKTLQSDALTAHIPVLAISASAMPRDIQRGLEAGFARYITKPIKVAQFLEALDLVLERAEESAARSSSP